MFYTFSFVAFPLTKRIPNQNVRYSLAHMAVLRSNSLYLYLSILLRIFCKHTKNVASNSQQPSKSTKTFDCILCIIPLVIKNHFTIFFLHEMPVNLLFYPRGRVHICIQERLIISHNLRAQRRYRVPGVFTFFPHCYRVPCVCVSFHLSCHSRQSFVERLSAVSHSTWHM